jgi:hypothetical protein
MPWLASGRMLDLLATRDAIGHNLDRVVRGLHGWKQTLLANRHGEGVMLGFIAE